MNALRGKHKKILIFKSYDDDDDDDDEQHLHYHDHMCVCINTRVGTLIVATIYLQLIKNRYVSKFYCPSV